MNKRILATSLALALAPAVHAASTITPAARPIDARGTVEVANVRGRIEVVGWSRNMVAVTGTLGEDSRLVFEGSGGRVVLKVERVGEKKGGWLRWNNGPSEDSLLKVHVPATASLELDAVSADILVSGISASDRLKMDSVSGDADVEADTGRLDINTVSGDVVFSGQADRANADSVSGDLRLQGLSGDLNIETVSGDVKVSESRLRQIDGGTVSGDLEFIVELVGNATVDVESMSGEVTLDLPASLSATVNAESFSGSLHADFPVDIIDESGPGSRMRGKLGSGDARIEIESFSGDVRLRKH